ncbi:MAG: hypothetical protein IPG91_04700 [Ideonella sp.]|nr:hypothetical protein [Ideonella sp.]
MDKRFRAVLLTLASSVVAISCGDGGSSASALPPSNEAAAAIATAQQNPMCIAIQPFYWEIGDRSGVIVSGSVGSGAPTRATPMAIASASKWLYAAYAVQKVGGVAGLDPVQDVPFLNFTSGYTWATSLGPGICGRDDTVQECVDFNNSTLDPGNLGLFNYDSGHMEVHAASRRIGLGPFGNLPLADAVLGTTTGSSNPGSNTYTEPLLAGGVQSSAAAYAAFLTRMLSGSLAMRDVLIDDGRALGTASYKVATTGPGTFSPLAGATNAAGRTENWNYSLGHWVEDDPTYGDRALSSAGAFGFYPWIDRTVTYYGIVARLAPPGGQQYEGFQSAQCGRLIRQAFVQGEAVITQTVPTP